MLSNLQIYLTSQDQRWKDSKEKSTKLYLHNDRRYVVDLQDGYNLENFNNNERQRSASVTEVELILI